MKNKKLNKTEIKRFQQNRYPYLMVDFITKFIPGEISEGYKDLDNNEWFFKVHWPKDPNMPGMLQIEALVQTAALAILTLPQNKGKTMYLISANNIKFFKKVLPGKRFKITTKVISFKRGIAECQGKGFVENQVACKEDFKLILPNEIRKFSKKIKKK